MQLPHLALPSLGRGVLAAGFLALAVGCSSNDTQEMTKEQKLGYYLENSLRYFDLKDLPRSINQADRGLALDPKNERLLLIKARGHLHLDTRDDILVAERILRRHPNQKDWRVRTTLGEALERKGLLFDLAADEIANGERDVPDGKVEDKVAEMRDRARATWAEASGHFQTATELFTGGIEPLNGLMRVQTFLDQRDEALATAQLLTQAIQDSSKVLRVRLRELEESENDTFGVRRQIFGNDELLAGVHLHMSELLHARGEHLDALAELDTVLELNPDWAQIYSRRAVLFLELGDPERARDAILYYMANSSLAYEHPDIQRAHEVLNECNSQLQAVDQADRIGNRTDEG